jgi:hypothetical protein
VDTRGTIGITISDLDNPEKTELMADLGLAKHLPYIPRAQKAGSSVMKQSEWYDDLNRYLLQTHDARTALGGIICAVDRTSESYMINKKAPEVAHISFQLCGIAAYLLEFAPEITKLIDDLKKYQEANPMKGTS